MSWMTKTTGQPPGQPPGRPLAPPYFCEATPILMVAQLCAAKSKCCEKVSSSPAPDRTDKAHTGLEVFAVVDVGTNGGMTIPCAGLPAARAPSCAPRPGRE